MERLAKRGESRMKRWVEELAATEFPKGRHSQGGQDGVLRAIFKAIGTVNTPPLAVEFGFDCDSLTGGFGSNVANLVLHEGWRAVLLDGGHENAAINLHREFLTSANIVEVFARHGVPAEPDYVSIDLDSTDLWVFRTLLTSFRARVFTVEYNSHFPLDAAITFPDDPDERWQQDRGYGASLKALVLVAEEAGYSLVTVVPKLDAVFVRNDLLDDGSGRLVPTLETWRPATSLRFHAPLAIPSRTALFLDYEVFRQTGGDLTASRAAARGVCEQCLLGGEAKRGPVRRLVNACKRFLRRLLGT
jgi:hypothetical protein